MQRLVFTDSEYQTLKDVLHDWGLIDTYFKADYTLVQNLKRQFEVFDEIDRQEPEI